MSKKNISSSSTNSSSATSSNTNSATVKETGKSKSKGIPVTSQEIADKIRQEAQGTIFSVGFMKRTNGEFRHMVCRLGVRRHLKGGEQGYDPIKKDLLTVYDVINRGYRMISLDSILWIRIRGELYTRHRNSKPSKSA